jgi:hypothetical protein
MREINIAFVSLVRSFDGIFNPFSIAYNRPASTIIPQDSFKTQTLKSTKSHNPPPSPATQLPEPPPPIPKPPPHKHRHHLHQRNPREPILPNAHQPKLTTPSWRITKSLTVISCEMVMFLQFIGPLQVRQQRLGRLPVDRHRSHHHHAHCTIRNRSQKPQQSSTCLCSEHDQQQQSTDPVAESEPEQPGSRCIQVCVAWQQDHFVGRLSVAHYSSIGRSLLVHWSFLSGSEGVVGCLVAEVGIAFRMISCTWKSTECYSFSTARLLIG